MAYLPGPQPCGILTTVPATWPDQMRPQLVSAESSVQTMCAVCRPSWFSSSQFQSSQWDPSRLSIDVTSSAGPSMMCHAKLFLLGSVLPVPPCWPPMVLSTNREYSVLLPLGSFFRSSSKNKFSTGTGRVLTLILRASRLQQSRGCTYLVPTDPSPRRGPCPNVLGGGTMQGLMPPPPSWRPMSASLAPHSS